MQIYRHGARNIQKQYPNDPFRDEKHWPEGLGQLTRVSHTKIQHWKHKMNSNLNSFQQKRMENVNRMNWENGSVADMNKF